MKVLVPISLYTDFQCFNQPQNDPNNPNVFFKQIPTAVGFYMNSPIRKQYHSNSGLDCVSWLVNQMFILKQMAYEFFKTNIPLKMTFERMIIFQQSVICWFCEIPLIDERVRDQDRLTGKHRGAVRNRCNLNC